MSTKEQKVAEIVAGHAGREGPLMPILHDVQAELGCVDGESERIIARELNLSRADVHGVVVEVVVEADHADPRPEVQICRAEACQARGVEALIPAAEKAAGDRVKLTTVYCLGLCSAGPSARVGDRLHARLDAKGLTQVIENA